MPITQLDHYYRQHRESFNDNFRLKIHRSLSWLKKAEQESDLDMQFVALWVAFNAAYAKELDERIGDRANFNEFLLKICALDEEKRVYNLAWTTFSQSIRMLLDNQFVFQPFWDLHNGKISETDYIKAQMQERERFLSALERQKTERILDVMFSRLYTLRNQILHGGSTHNSRVNREQLSDGCRILLKFVPTMLQIMMENHDQMDWGKAYYPVVNV